MAVGAGHVVDLGVGVSWLGGDGNRGRTW
jgi:hypothetical protein